MILPYWVNQGEFNKATIYKGWARFRETTGNELGVWGWCNRVVTTARTERIRRRYGCGSLERQLCEEVSLRRQWLLVEGLGTLTSGESWVNGYRGLELPPPNLPPSPAVLPTGWIQPDARGLWSLLRRPLQISLLGYTEQAGEGGAWRWKGTWRVSCSTGGHLRAWGE